MKEEKLFEIVNNIDDDLICEMLDYGADTEKKGEEYEGALYSGPEKPRKIHYWKYPVTAAALMLVLAGVLFIFNANNTLPYNEEEITGSGEGAPDVSDDTVTEQEPIAELARPPREVQEYSLDYEPLEDTPDTVLATSFVNDFFYAKDIGDPVLWYDYLDLDKYFDNPYLKRYVEYNIDKWTMKNSGEIIFYEPDYVVAFYSKQAGDINYISVATERFWIYKSLYPDWSGTGETAVVGIRDGKVVNFSIFGLGGHWIANLWDEDFDSANWDSYDFTDHENPWDNEEYAKKILDGLGIVMPENTETATHALDLLHCRLSEDGHYRVDDDAITESDDYDLFRKYFFGAWDGAFSYHFLKDTYGIVIDDSLNSFNMQSREPWYTGNFYRIGDSTLSFITGSMVGGTVFWLDMNDPETMYSAGGGFGEYNWIWTEEEDEMPVVSVLKKTDLPPNEPEDNFMSIFKLREISRDYGIDIELLTDLGFEYYGEDGGRYWLSHDYMMSFYPVYLVSQSPDKLEFTATVTGSYNDVEAEAYYTAEKIDGEWVRTEEGYRNVKDNIVGSLALHGLRCYPDEEGIYRVDQKAVTAIDDYDLFRKYFFGTWEGKSESERMVIDDSLKSFNMNQHSTWYSGLFYRIGDNTYAFVKGGGEPMVYWLSTLYPDTMYAAYGEVEYWLKSTNEDKTAPEVYSLKKTSAPINKPEENFLSIFKLHEISQDYGIDYNLLMDIEYGYDGGGVGYLLQHNDSNRFYPVYLVSQSADRLVLKTSIGIGDARDKDLEIEVSCIFEKSDGKWTRTVSASSLDWEVTLIGDYDRSALVDFDYSEALAKVVESDEIDTGSFLDDGCSEFKELYQKAYALTGITVSSPDNFPNAVGLGTPTVKWENAVQIHVTDESYPIGYRTYYLTGYSWDSFYDEMLSVFTKEQADEHIFGNKLFYNYEGALWCSNAATGGDITRVYTEYAVEKTEDILDIIRTTYHVPLGETPEFDPEKIDEYETKITHFKFTRYGGTWLAFEFADVR